MRPLSVALVPGQQRSLDKLKKMRVALANELTDLIDELGPKLWDDFQHVRRLVISTDLEKLLKYNFSGEFLFHLQITPLQLVHLVYGGEKAKREA